MTARELIEKLEKLPPDAVLMVNGYEGGANDLTVIEEIAVVLNYHKPNEWWYGKHEIACDFHITKQGLPTVKVWLLA